MPETARLILPLIAAGQAQKDVTHNEAIMALERLVALAVASRTLAEPPSSPPSGQCHIVPAAGVAAWGQPAGTLMHWQGNGWLAQPPIEGQIALVADEALVLVYRAGWQSLWPVAGLSIAGRSVLAATPASVAAPLGGSTVDSEARTAIAALIAALRQQGVLA
ncbi:DUF2793 domain-containing protein [Sandarakinorhabdus oryzae]|uniref:DUF2793 domain-containing protein n=1 Tax=Sandarakinorhabdus oryzae TaxID=2675220 RepID=UPI0012E0CA99|nr:DUF2793 domain-containing protein [Sandarakinorhabdus oryzae]